MRIFTRLCFSALFLASAQASPLQIFYPHLQSPYPSPSPLPHALWLYPSFTRQDFEHERLTSFLLQGGYDHSFSPTHTLGLGLQYGYSKHAQSPLHSLGILLQDRIFLGAFSISSNLHYASSLDSHLIFGSLELAYKLNLPLGFFLAPALKGGVGYLSTADTPPYLIQAGSFVGVDFGSSGSLALGALYERELSGDDRLLLSLRASFRASERFELFLQHQNSFLGKTELGYNIGLGLRFFWGSKTITHSPKHSDKSRSVQDVQRELLRQAELSRQRIAAKTHLKPEELAHRYETQDHRNSPFVQDEIKSSSRQRYIRESSKWINTKSNEANYQNRNLPNLRSKDLDKIKDLNRRELERKYGK